MFVIRDFVGSTPLENLADILRADLKKIWDGLRKVCSFRISNILCCIVRKS